LDALSFHVFKTYQSLLELPINDLINLEALQQQTLNITKSLQAAVVLVESTIQNEKLKKKTEETALKKKKKVEHLPVNGSVSDMNRESVAQNIVGNVMDAVAESADKVESTMKEKDLFKEGQNSQGSSLETVVKVEEKKEKLADKPEAKALDSNAPVLIDSQNNEYRLTQTNDLTAHYEDGRLLQDFQWILLISFGLAGTFYLIRLPSLFGYILTGVILSNGGFIRSMVQLETLGHGLGVLLIMFSLGLEFRLSNIRKVWQVSVFGTLLMLLSICTLTAIAGFLLNTAIAGALVIGACLFLSSTAVVLRLLGPLELEFHYGRSILGILVMQDVLLGVLIASLPLLTESGTEMIASIGLKFGHLILFLLIVAVLYFPLGFLLNGLNVHGNYELCLLAYLSVCIGFVQIAEYLELSLELPAFVAGMVIASYRDHGEKANRMIMPLRDVFAALFFVAMGFHIFPSFFWSQMGLLILLCLSGMLIKFIIVTGMMYFIFQYPSNPSIMMGLALCQLSEFGFVLASKAKR
jgi:Kef-type K+ transport system membrane component KefB